MQDLRKPSFLKFIPGIIWFAFVLTLIALPGKDIPKTFLDELDFDKVVHMGVFGMLTTLFCWPFKNTSISIEKRKKYFLYIAIATSIWGYCTELIQKFWIVGRTYDPLDWLADSIGAAIGYFFSKKRYTKS
ncbi:VanZ family protein [Ferruginibacter albus]|uniref:VanZ family protein n=1 Tax=Ferruginibacter albus TaxID=2875540 RepID=UPI001CC7822D|nr:VanZ family protein [Ferruginibacter albus]UAY52339.1 VanZ family protein [Ferruginibacter albus]